MRYVYAAAVIALSVFIPSQASGQVLSITNYQLVSERTISRTVSELSYRADVVNTGPARASVTATMTTSSPAVKLIPDNDLRFSNVPANGQVTSTDTFTIQVDRTLLFNFSSVQWAFSAAADPVAHAGADQTRPVGATVTLNGSLSTNPGGVGTLSYSWAFTSRPAGSTAVLNNPTAVMPSFLIDKPGSYLITLTVSNGLATDTDTVAVNTSNSPPVADAGLGQTVAVGSTVTLNGSKSSDVDGNPLIYKWTLTTKPAGSTAALTGANTVAPTFVADKAGTYVAQLIVNDGSVDSAPKSVTINTSNTPPVAKAGDDQQVNVGTVVQLNGSGSTDADGNPLTYRWNLNSVPAGSTAVLSSTTAVNPTFTADRPGNYVAQLIVNDGSVDSAADTVLITTNTVLAPTADAGLNQTVKHGTLVTLSGSGTDPQGRPLTFQWSLTTKPAGSTAVLSSSTVANPSFTADLPGNYVAQLIVNNGFLNSAPDTVTITTTNTAPVANAGSNQNAVVGNVVTLNGTSSSDADGDPLTYSWSFTTKPAGSTAALSAATSPTPTFIPDKTGAYVAQLIVNDGIANSVPKTVTITAGAASAASITATAGTPQSVNINTAFAPLQATVKDAGGNPVSGVNVTFTAPATGASGNFTGGAKTIVVATNALGVASAAFTANGTAGPYNVTAAAAGVATPASFALTNTAGSAASITATGGTPQSKQINTAFAPLQATVKDAGGNPLTGVNVTFTAPATGASGNFTGGVKTIVVATNALGVASAAFTANGTAGPYNVTAAAAGVATPASFALTNTAGAAASITATGGTPQSKQINTAFAPLQATVKDAGGNPVSGVNVTFTAPATGASGTFTGGVKTIVIATDAAGVASAAFTANGTTGPYNVTAAAAGVATPASFALTNTAGAAASITATGGTPQSKQINTAFAPLQATVKDAGGNPVSGVNVTFTAPATGASGNFTGGVKTIVIATDASGVASAAFTANGTTGPYNVTAAAAGVATPASFALTNTAGAAASITATSGTPQSKQINTAFAPLQATVKDAGGNPVSGVNVTFTAPATGASGSFTGGVKTIVIATDASGLASAAFTANATTGSYNVTAAAAGVATPASFALTNTAGAAASITATSGTPQSKQINTAFAPLQATVKDAGGNPVSGVNVTFTAPATGASGSFTGGVKTIVIATDASGLASAAFTANATTGSYNVTAAAAGVATPASFALTNTAGAAASITATSGTPQSKQINTAFAPLQATVKDAGGNPVSGVSVTFTAPATGASGSFTGGVKTIVIATDASGVASAAFTANGTVGPYNVTAAAAGVATPASFALTNTAGAAASITATAGTPQTVNVNTAFAPLQATVKDAGGNPVSGVNVTFTAPATGASGNFTGGVKTIVIATNASGVASAAFTANATAGSYNVTAAAARVATPATFALTNAPVITGQLSITGATVGQNLQTTVTISLPQAAPTGGVNVTVTSSNTNLARVARLAGDAGATAPLVVNVPQGQQSVNIFVQGFAASGTAQLTASATGLTSGTSTITLTPAGFVMAGPGGLGVSSFNANQGTTDTPLTVSAGRLDSSLNYVETQQVRGGLTVSVPISSSAPSIGVAAPASLLFTGGISSLVSNFQALSAGFTILTAGVPAGFVQPGAGYNTLTASVLSTGLLVPNVTVGQNLETTASIRRNTANASPVSVTVTSGDQSKLLFSLTASAAGSPSITLNIPAGGTATPQFFVHGLVSSGSASYTAAATGFGTTTGTVNFAPSGFVIETPPGDFLVTSAAPNIDVIVVPYILDAGLNPAAPQRVRGGLTVNVAVTSSNPAIGTITTSPVQFTGGSDLRTTQFDPATPGNTTIALTTPAGFSNPATDDSRGVTVITAQLVILPNLLTIGKNLQAPATLLIGEPAPAGGLAVRLTSNSGNLKLSASETTAGVAVLDVTIPQDQSSVIFYVQALADSGIATYTATAAGYSPRDGQVNLVPSGVVIAGSTGFGTNVQAPLNSGPQPVSIFTVRLAPGSNVPDTQNGLQALAGGMTLSVGLTNSNPSVGTVVTPVTINGGSGEGVTQFTPLAVGSTTISILTPGNFAQPSQFTTVTAQVSP